MYLRDILIIPMFDFSHRNDTHSRAGHADHLGVQEVYQTPGSEGRVCLWRDRDIGADCRVEAGM